MSHDQIVRVERSVVTSIKLGTLPAKLVVGLNQPACSPRSSQIAK